MESQDRIQAFSFEEDQNQLFAVLHPAETRDEGFVICYPAPQDMMHAQQSQITLAKKLQSMGFPVLRFDYSGTGDSTGKIRTTLAWKNEILAAVHQLKIRTGVKRVSLVGTRLGGSLAILASQEQPFARLLLWDPVLVGADLIGSYRSLHKRILNRVPDEAPYPFNQKEEAQSCGYPWPQSIQEAIQRIEPSLLSSLAKKIQIVSSEEQTALPAVIDRWQRDGIAVTNKNSGEDMHWGQDLYLTLRAFAPASIRLLAQYAEER